MSYTPTTEDISARNFTQQISARRGWAPLIVLPIAVLLFTPAEWPRWVFMWLLSAGIFAGCKWLTWRRTVATGAQWWQHAGYLLAWPGLDAGAFLSSERLPARERVRASEWGIGALMLVIGVALFWVVAGWVSEDHEIIFGWLGRLA